MKRANLKPIKIEEISKKIKLPAHSNRGILYLIENEKNNVNPYDGDRLNFIGSGKSADGLKRGIANSFKIQGNITLSKLIKEESEKYPSVKKFLKEITKA
ncbi:hypothetical protein [Clostridium grantii]|uniref:hypothetical protein n=1 Tax=Clostridium grantii TaxID=40575 RepID=UPI0011603F48|nr:hypothetical protein [Clostridium grantii]